MLEKFLTQLMAQAGLSPAMLVDAYNKVMAWDAEKEAFKSGAANVVAHFNARLTAIETQQAEIMRLLRPPYPEPDIQPIAKPNGEDHP